MAYRGHQKQQDSFGGSGWGNQHAPPLTLTNTLVLHAGFVVQGATDAMKLKVAGEKISMDKLVQANVLKSSVIQGIVLVSALVVKPILRRLVGLRPHEPVTASVVFFGFHLFWLWPLAAAATYYSGLLRPASETDKRRSAGGDPNRGMVVKVVSESYRTLVTLNYFLFFYALRLIPFLGVPLGFLYASVVDAYYCFEAHWVKNGWSFGDRVRQIEQRWAYAFGYGLPITLLSSWSSDPIVNLAVFALLFPLFSLTSSVAIPQPLDPALPGSSSSATPAFMHGASGLGHGSFSIAAAEGGAEDRGRKGSALVPIRIRVLVVAELVYAALAAAFGLSSGGAGGSAGRKKDAGMGHGHGASPARMAMAQRVNAFDPNYGATPPQDVFGAGAGGGGSAYGGSAYGGSPVRGGGGAGPAPQRYSMESDPYGTSVGAGGVSYAGAGQAAATPPRRGYAAPDGGLDSSVYSSPTRASPYGGAYAPPPQQQQQQAAQSPAGYGGDRTLDQYIRQAGLRGKNKGD
ncbi:EI24 domain-containing protein [Rhodotorula paludigena]|uniref:EI24 domain-containing protein n=1 Tax=Rhodotorula paludigena TaxID=86838 RepID=UPI003173AC6A